MLYLGVFKILTVSTSLYKMDNSTGQNAPTTKIIKHAGGVPPCKDPMEYFSYLRNTKSYWLLLQGAVDSPKKYKPISSSKHENDTKKEVELPFLKELVTDLKTVNDFLHEHKKYGTHLFSYSFQMRQTKETTLEEIRKLIKGCIENKAFPVIYYTGHGELGTGNWCFVNNENDQEHIGITEIINLIPEDAQCKLLTIISDCCYSGHWADYCASSKESKEKVMVLASAPHYSSCEDGMFIRSLLSPTETEFNVPPVIGSYQHFFIDRPHLVTAENFEQFFLGHSLKRSNREGLIISCSFANNRLCAILAREDKSQSEKSFFKRKFQRMKKLWTKHSYTKIIAKTKSGYFVYQQKQQIRAERIAQDYLIEENVENIREKIRTGGRVISCCPGENKEWIIVKNKLPTEQDSKYIPFNIVEEYTAIEKCTELIKEKAKEGYILSVISYNKITDSYLVFMNHSPDENMMMEWFDNTDDSFRKAFSWLEKQMGKGENFQPYLIFKDWKSAKTLISLTDRKGRKLSDIDLILNAEITPMPKDKSTQTDGYHPVDKSTQTNGYHPEIQQTASKETAESANQLDKSIQTDVYHPVDKSTQTNGYHPEIQQTASKETAESANQLDKSIQTDGYHPVDKSTQTNGYHPEIQQTASKETAESANQLDKSIQTDVYHPVDKSTQTNGYHPEIQQTASKETAESANQLDKSIQTDGYHPVDKSTQTNGYHPEIQQTASKETAESANQLDNQTNGYHPENQQTASDEIAESTNSLDNQTNGYHPENQQTASKEIAKSANRLDNQTNGYHPENQQTASDEIAESTNRLDNQTNGYHPENQKTASDEIAESTNPLDNQTNGYHPENQQTASKKIAESTNPLDNQTNGYRPEDQQTASKEIAESKNPLDNQTNGYHPENQQTASDEIAESTNRLDNQTNGYHPDNQQTASKEIAESTNRLDNQTNGYHPENQQTASKEIAESTNPLDNQTNGYHPDNQQTASKEIAESTNRLDNQTNGYHPENQQTASKEIAESTNPLDNQTNGYRPEDQQTASKEIAESANPLDNNERLSPRKPTK